MSARAVAAALASRFAPPRAGRWTMSARPLPPRARRLLLALFACGVLAALVYGLVLDPPRVALPAVPLRTDLMLHVATFCTLALLAALLWSPAVSVAGLMVAAGGALELAQSLCGRDMALSDWAASAAGAVLGVLLACAAARTVLPLAVPAPVE